MNDQNILESLDKDELITVLLWTINDINSWANNDAVTKRIRGYASMLEEAIWYQINKELIPKGILVNRTDAEKEEE